MLSKDSFLYSSVAVVVALLILTAVMFYSQQDKLPPATARLVAVLKHAKNNSQSERDELVVSEAITMYLEGNTTAPKVLQAVSYLTGDKSPAVKQTVAGLIIAGASPSLIAEAAQQVGLNNQEVVAALVENGADPTTIITSTAASGVQSK